MLHAFQVIEARFNRIQEEKDAIAWDRARFRVQSQATASPLLRNGSSKVYLEGVGIWLVHT